MAKTIVITGCTKGIGRAIADLFAQMGFNVAGCARNNNEVNQLNQSLQAINNGGKHLILPCDVSDSTQIKSFTDAITATYGTIDILVNNAGVFLPGNIIDEQEGTLEHFLNTNVTSAYKVSKAFIPGMMEAKKGHIFNICSIASLQAYEGGGSYSISKFALLGFSKQLRHELKPHHIRVTAIMPGATLTNSWAGVDLPEERFIKAEDIAKAIKSVYEMSEYTDVEEMVIRPLMGDI
jgi:NADP-dependent 3-hydroxy acid dehydrogenase YdfG